MKQLRLILIALLAGYACLTTASAAPSFLTDSEWLEEHIDDKNLIILEVRYYPHRYFTVGHIKGAVQVQRFRDLGDNESASLMKFPSKEAFQSTLRRWGVNNDSSIVIYDDSSTALASRLYYLLELYGFDMTAVKILNGGTLGWQNFNELSKDQVVKKPGNVTLKQADRALYVEWTDVYDRVVSARDAGMVLLDARPYVAYTGAIKTHAVRAGHIPGAVNIVSMDGVVRDQMQWKTQEALAQIYSSLPKDKTIIIYCHDGFRMSLAYIQLKSLGYRQVRLYDGGWGHWGNKLALPIVMGNEPYDDAFKL